jgi:2-iminobutanoate/2-iminopropanoate deaminase
MHREKHRRLGHVFGEFVKFARKGYHERRGTNWRGNHVASVCPWIRRGIVMKKEIIRVEPLATYLERWKAPTSTVVKHGNTLYVTGAPPYEPETGEIFGGDIRRQAELVLEQLKACVEAGGSSLENVLQCTVYSTSQEYFAPINEVYVKYFPTNWPARMFLCVQPWAGALRRRNDLHCRNLRGIHVFSYL